MLAIGIVVDDAIVVLENIERWLDKGLPVREATIKAMDEITGPIIAITLVLSSVLLPSAFLGGITGQFFRQFALTISASMIISAVNAMTMTPARAASIFAGRKPGTARRPGQRSAAVVELRPVRRFDFSLAAEVDVRSSVKCPSRETMRSHGRRCSIHFGSMPPWQCCSFLVR